MRYFDCRLARLATASSLRARHGPGGKRAQKGAFTSNAANEQRSGEYTSRARVNHSYFGARAALPLMASAQTPALS